MIGSVLLHVTVAVLLMISWSFTRNLKVGEVVPVTIVSRAPAEPKPAEQAPVEQQAQAPEPEPQAPPTPPPPAPAPKPTPAPPKPVPPPPKPVPPVPTPKPTPKVEPKPIPAPPPKPTPPQPQAKPQKSLDLDALSASISSLSKSTAKASAPTRGPAQTQASPTPHPTLGAAQSAAAIRGLSDELQRRWNPNCDVEGGRDVKLKVVFTIGEGGQVVGNATAQIVGAVTPVSRAAQDRAVSAVYAAAPFRNLPREFYGQRITVNFNAQEACSR
ncbi:MAG: energy transducer TonB [Proteobacteria bacterium]|nr:energy transducer TonB [Pseudomonadota bacterium]